MRQTRLTDPIGETRGELYLLLREVATGKVVRMERLDVRDPSVPPEPVPDPLKGVAA